MSEFNKCRREGRIHWGDDFDSLQEVFGLFEIENPEVLRETFFPVPGKENVLCCIVSETGDGDRRCQRELGPTRDARGWNETLSYAENTDSVENLRRLVDSDFAAPKTRLVFWRENRAGQSWYKFAGVFKLDHSRTVSHGFNGERWCWYDRVDTVAECPKADWSVMAFGANERYRWDAGLQGELVKCELLDVVECEDGDGNCLGKSERIWPGTVLRVVDGWAGAQLRCMIDGVERRFLIPRRDFELGYFRLLGGKVGDTKLVESAVIKRPRNR